MTHRALTRRTTPVVFQLRTRQRSAALLAVACLALASCSATATYTRDTVAVTCYRPATYPGFGLVGLLTAPFYAYDTAKGASDYAACKTALERAGFVRQP